MLRCVWYKASESVSRLYTVYEMQGILRKFGVRGSRLVEGRHDSLFACSCREWSEHNGTFLVKRPGREEPSVGLETE